MFAPLEVKQSCNFYFTTPRTDFQFFSFWFSASLRWIAFPTKYFAPLGESEVLAPPTGHPSFTISHRTRWRFRGSLYEKPLQAHRCPVRNFGIPDPSTQNQGTFPRGSPDPSNVWGAIPAVTAPSWDWDSCTNFSAVSSFSGAVGTGYSFTIEHKAH